MKTLGVLCGDLFELDRILNPMVETFQLSLEDEDRPAKEYGKDVLLVARGPGSTHDRQWIVGVMYRVSYEHPTFKCEKAIRFPVPVRVPDSGPERVALVDHLKGWTAREFYYLAEGAVARAVEVAEALERGAAPPPLAP